MVTLLNGDNMKTLFLFLALSLTDSTIQIPNNFTAKEAKILSETSLKGESQKVYDYLKSQIYKEAENRGKGVIVDISKDKFSKFYSGTSGQNWKEAMIIITRLQYEGYNADLMYNSKNELRFIVKW